MHTEDSTYQRARVRMRRRPSFLLKRRERQIIARRWPDNHELAELAAIRRELTVRGHR